MPARLPYSGDRLDTVPGEHRIGGDDQKVVQVGCGDDHSVARIGVDGRQFGRAQTDREIQLQHFEIMLFEDRCEPVGM